ncbi:MAG TPA: ribosome biogenesis GTPase YlqF, partial [Prochlorococcus sp.]|nr:ribosome biogenesis GTPase YlqF [Prochlorococcus sp.]
CDDIGQAAYDVELVALALLETLRLLEKQAAAGVVAGILEQRYGINLAGDQADAHAWLMTVAERHTSGDTGRMAQRLLDDFRRALLGPIALELPLP